VVSPQILDQHYKIWPSIDHRAKFHADRPTHLGYLMIGIKKINKTSAAKHKPTTKVIASGRNNNTTYQLLCAVYCYNCKIKQKTAKQTK